MSFASLGPSSRTRFSWAELSHQRQKCSGLDHDPSTSAFLACFDREYRSEQPAHPSRGFGGREQVEKNWSALFEGIPDFHAELLSTATEGDTVWSEWHSTGTRRANDTPLEHARSDALRGQERADCLRSALYGGRRRGRRGHRRNRTPPGGREWVGRRVTRSPDTRSRNLSRTGRTRVAGLLFAPRPRVLKLMYPSRTRVALSVFKTYDSAGRPRDRRCKREFAGRLRPASSCRQEQNEGEGDPESPPDGSVPWAKATERHQSAPGPALGMSLSQRRPSGSAGILSCAPVARGGEMLVQCHGFSW